MHLSALCLDQRITSVEFKLVAEKVCQAVNILAGAISGKPTPDNPAFLALFSGPQNLKDWKERKTNMLLATVLGSTSYWVLTHHIYWSLYSTSVSNLILASLSVEYPWVAKSNSVLIKPHIFAA